MTNTLVLSLGGNLNHSDGDEYKKDEKSFIYTISSNFGYRRSNDLKILTDRTESLSNPNLEMLTPLNILYSLAINVFFLDMG